MFQMTDVILIALFIEAIVNALKPLWTKGEGQLTVSDYVSMGMGVLLAVTCRINMLAFVLDANYPEWVEYIFYALTGVAIGRGTNFLYDLWGKLKEWQNGGLKNETGAVIDDGMSFNLDFGHWSLAELENFCKMNSINTDGCASRKEYIGAIERAFEGGEPPENGGEE